jgi:hypothetical protein
MAIDVTCSGCKTRFQVSDKFAGKKGPCPKCKAIIQVPEKKDEVVIHVPETSGPKNAQGVAVLQPIFREEVRLSVPLIAGIVASVVIVLVMALVLRFTAQKPGQIDQVMTILGSIVLAPPLVFAGYTFLRDDELEPYRGLSLALRLIPCSVVYPLLWGIYWFVFAYLEIQPQLLHMIVVVPAMIALGAVAAQASLDLEFGQAALHYALYLSSMVVLRLLMGMNGYWNVVT